jgi:hypothetical protein
METLVLIPQELSLALTPGGARGREASVSVWSSTEIQRGSLLYPFQGTIRIDKLHVYSYVPDHDVSFSFILAIFTIDYYKLSYRMSLVFLSCVSFNDL